MEWELIDDGCPYTERMKVYGGWLVRTGSSEYMGLCFIPDVNYNWNIAP